jgi:hypothetical protein
MQDGFLKLSVVTQAARTAELDDDIRSGLKGIGEVSQDMLEGGADVVRGILRAYLVGAACGRRQGEVFCVQYLLYEELERRIIVAITKECHTDVLMALVWLLLAG